MIWPNSPEDVKQRTEPTLDDVRQLKKSLSAQSPEEQSASCLALNRTARQTRSRRPGKLRVE
jgi:hypothetical protein